MCLGFAPVYYMPTGEEEVEKAKTLHQGHGKEISCKDSITYIARTARGGVAVIQSIPVTGTDTVVFPIRPEHACKLLPCDALHCQESRIEGIIQPWRYVGYHENMEYHGPIYRSLASASRTPTIPVKIAELKVCHNKDGGAIATIPVAKHVTRSTTADDHAKLGTPMLECVIAGLEAASIAPNRVFGPEYDKDDSATKLEFLSFLLEAVTPGCDIVIGITPEGKKEGRFTFCYYDEDDLDSTVPLLGLVHGDKFPMQRVEETTYVLSNDPSIKLLLSKDKPYEGEDERRLGRDVEIHLQNCDAYVKDCYNENPVPDKYEEYFEPCHTGERGPHTHGNHMWAESQKNFQKALVSDLNKDIDAFVHDATGEHMSNNEVLFVSNMDAMRVPRNTVEAAIIIDPRAETSPQGTERNAEIRKRRNDEELESFESKKRAKA